MTSFRVERKAESAPRGGVRLQGPIGRWPRWRLVLSCLVLVTLVGAADYLTGHEILFSSFYLLPVGLAAWQLGRAFAVFIALLSVGAWLVGDLAAGAVFPHAFVPLWNAGIIFAFYLVVVSLIARLRQMNRDLEVRVRQRTIALTEEIAERERLEREVLDVGERERRRVGRDLHDSLGQLLTGTALAGQVLREKLAARAPEEATAAERVVRLVEEAIEMTRALARGLDPAEIDGGGLEQGLRLLAARTSELSPARCEYRGDAPVPIHDNVTATHLYRIAQEAITNAIKHGQAAHIDVRLESANDRARLTVHDDGRGLPPASRRVRGMGLRIMAHRAAVVGGTFEIRAEPSGGTTVLCEVPNP
ncbi:MAG TPA: sensor histidine kinase [Candidatus Acidoferrales bacterium]|nr:sensor histidine kinase [Candidatus Acidoferrales bacterium]